MKKKFDSNSSTTPTVSLSNPIHAIPLTVFFNETPKNKHLRTKILRSFEQDWLVCIGRDEGCNRYARKTLHVVGDLLLARYDYDREEGCTAPRLGQKSFAYIARMLKRHKLQVSQFILRQT